MRQWFCLLLFRGFFLVFGVVRIFRHSVTVAVSVSVSVRFSARKSPGTPENPPPDFLKHDAFYSVFLIEN
jgi:hypothetical protein